MPHIFVRMTNKPSRIRFYSQGIVARIHVKVRYGAVSTVVGIVGIIMGGMLSFLALGMLWIGNLSATIFVLPFFALASFALCSVRGVQLAVLSLGAGAIPLGMLLVMFRDASGSHMLPIATVLSWYVAIAIGIITAVHCSVSMLRLAVYVVGFSICHGMLAIALHAMLVNINDVTTSLATYTHDTAALLAATARILIEPGFSTIQRLPASERLMQWLFSLMSSITWGTGIAFIVSWLIQLTAEIVPIAHKPYSCAQATNRQVS